MELNASAEEISRLQRCINNLLSLLALPTAWSGSEPSRILESLFDALLPLLSLDFISGRLQDPVSNTPVAVLRLARSCDLEPHEIHQGLSDCFEGDGQKCLSVTRKQFGDKSIAVLPVPLELRGGTGMILAGSRREDFPAQNESLVLSAAAKQASIWLNEARLLTQRKPATDRLETHVAERAKELFEANENLKRSEEALQAREGDLRSIIDAIPTLAWSAGPDGSADFLNRRWLDYTGLSEKQAQGWGWGTAIHRADVEGLVKHWQSALASGVPVEAEARMRRFDGAYRWFLFLANPLRDELGNVIKWYGTNVDIEDRKRVEEGLRASELSWRQTVDNIPGFVIVTDPMGKVEFLNRQVLEYFGKTSEDLKIWDVIDVVHPDDLPRSIEARKKSIETGQMYEAELRCRRADGVYRWFQVRSIPVRDEENKITARYLLLTDIEDRKRGEEALQSNERNLNLILNTIPTHIYVLNGEGSVQGVNQAVMDYTGLTLDDVQQEDYRDRVIHPEDFKRVRGERAASLRQGAPFSTEQRVLGNDGQFRWFLVRYKPLVDEKGRIVRWYVAAFDIEDRKRAEQALEQTQVYLNEAQRLAHIGSWAFNAAGFGYWSSELFQIHGLDSKDRPPTVEEYLDLVHPEDREFMQQGIQKMLVDRLGSDFTKRIVRPDGKIRHVRWVGVPVADGATFRGFVGTGMDVTEQELLMQRLRQSEADLRAITDAIRQSIVVLAPDGTALYANRVALDNTGLTMDEVKGDGFFLRAFHPDDLNRVRDDRRVGLLEGVPFDLEVRALFKNGRYRWQLLQYNPLKDEQGQIIRWYATATDIDDRKKAEVALEASQRNLNLLINAIRIYIVVLRADGSVLYVNKAVLDYHGATLEDVQQKGYRPRFFHPEDLERVSEERQKALARGAPFENEQRLLRHDGVYRWFLVRYDPLRDQQGKIDRWYVAATDIDDRKRAEAQVEQAYLRLAEAQRLSKTGSFITDLVADEHNWSEETFRIFVRPFGLIR
jgi:PAS domain S-box-containing protein